MNGRTVVELTLRFTKPLSGKCVKTGTASHRLTFIVGACAPGTMHHLMPWLPLFSQSLCDGANEPLGSITDTSNGNFFSKPNSRLFHTQIHLKPSTFKVFPCSVKYFPSLTVHEARIWVSFLTLPFPSPSFPFTSSIPSSSVNYASECTYSVTLEGDAIVPLHVPTVGAFSGASLWYLQHSPVLQGLER